MIIKTFVLTVLIVCYMDTHSLVMVFSRSGSFYVVLSNLLTHYITKYLLI